MDITVVGLGHLGLPLAALLAAAGHRVRGVDHNAAHVENLRAGIIAWHEPGLADLLARAAPCLSFGTDTAQAAAASVASIIAVPTPADASGGYDDSQVVAAAAALGDGLAAKARHTVIVLSTVMPGTLAARVAPALGRSAGLCYSPAFGAIGELLTAYSRPDFLLIGQSSAQDGDLAEALIRSIHDSPVPVLRRTLLDAELAKLALNNFLITKISFATMIGMLCAGIPGADAAQVLSVLGNDRRIGAGFLRAAMPYGGPCFSRDAGALLALGARQGQPALLAAGAEAINRAHFAALSADIRAATPPGGRIAVLGLAFRPKTDVTEASPTLELALSLAAEGYAVTCWDPMARPALAGAVLAGSLEAAVEGAATIVIGNDDPSCAALPDLRRPDGSAVTVFDYWRRLRAEDGARFEVRRF